MRVAVPTAMRALLAIPLLAATASADPGPRVALGEPPGATPPERADAVAIAAHVPTPLDDVAAHDAAADRAIGFGTAVLLRPGQVDVSGRSVLNHAGIASVAVGVTHDLELSVQGMRAGTYGVDFGVGAKVALARHATYSLALTGNLTAGERQFVSTTLAYSTCLVDCAALVTIAGGLAKSDDYSQGLIQGTTPIADASIIMGRSWARPLVELAWFGDSLGYAGMRFGNRYVALDVGAGVIDASESGDTSVGAVVGLSVRP
jgi:hypothetical protein